MRHAPKKLALLISMIGAGVSPLACARSGERISSMQSASDQVLEEASAASILDRTESSEFTLQTGEGELDPARPLDVVLSTVDAIDEINEIDRITGIGEISDISEIVQINEPGTEDLASCEEAEAAPQHAESANAAVQSAEPAQAEVVPIDSKPSAQGPLHRMLGFMQGFIAKHQALDADSSPDESSMQPAATVRYSAAPLVQPNAPSLSVYADRLMDDLASVVLKNVDISGSAFEQLASEPQASNECGERGAMSVECTGTMPATHADRVLEMLLDITSAREARRIDIDLTLPFNACHADAAVSISESNDVQVVMEPPPVAMAAQREARPSPFGDKQVALSEESLNGVRGGFVTEGLNISFGIERAVYVNGTLVTTTSLNVSDLGRISAGRGTTPVDTGALALVQTGAGNTVSSGTFSGSSAAAVVQNTLDGQKIQNVTVINATVNSLSLLKSFNLQSSLRGAVIDSLRR